MNPSESQHHPTAASECIEDVFKWETKSMAGHMGMLPPLCIDKIKAEVRGLKGMSSDVLQIDIFNILLFIYFKK